jgi:zinc protease
VRAIVCGFALCAVSAGVGLRAGALAKAWPRAIAEKIIGAPYAASARQAPDRSKPPAPGPVPSLTLPPIERRTLPNGLAVWLIERHDVPIVDVTVIIRAGADTDPMGRYGLASFTAAMLAEGAGGRDAVALADAVARVGATITADATFDATTVHLHVLASRLDAALPILADEILRPTFAQDAIERVRQDRLTDLLQTRDSPAALAEAALSRFIFGATHRYGTPIAGTRAATTAITPSDLRGFYDAHYRAGLATVLVAGDVTASTLVPELERTFGPWARGTTTPSPAPAAPPTTSGPATRRIYLVNAPGASQSQIRMGAIGAPRNTLDAAAIDALNTILGGPFTSRLNQNLRETHHYAYRATSAFVMRRAAGPFEAGGAVQADKTAEALGEFFKEIDRLHDATVPADELARARNMEALSFPAAFETTAGLSSEVAPLVIYDLPESRLRDYVANIETVSADDVQAAARRYLDSSRFVTVVVGDLAHIEAPIRAAHLGDVQIVTADDVLN